MCTRLHRYAKRCGQVRGSLLLPHPRDGSATTPLAWQVRGLSLSPIRCPAQLSVGFSDPYESAHISTRSESITITSTITSRSHIPLAPKPSFPSFPSVKTLPAPQHPCPSVCTRLHRYAKRCGQVRGSLLLPHSRDGSAIRGLSLSPIRCPAQLSVGFPSSPPSVVRHSYPLGSPPSPSLPHSIRVHPCPSVVPFFAPIRCPAQLSVGLSSPLFAPKPPFPSFPSVKTLPAPQHPCLSVCTRLHRYAKRCGQVRGSLPPPAGMWMICRFGLPNVSIHGTREVGIMKNVRNLKSNIRAKN